MDLSQRVRDVLALDPSAPAIEFEHDWWSWGELAAVGDAVDRLLTAASLGDGSPIGVVMRNRPTAIATLWNVLATRRTLVTLRPVHPDASLAADVERLRLPAVVADAEDWARPGVVDAARAAGSLGISIPTARGGTIELVPGSSAPGPGPHHDSLPGVAVEMLTSGTTGPAKRVHLRYRSLEASFEGVTHYISKENAERVTLKEGVGILWTPLVHISGLWHTIAAIVEGRKIALLERFDVDRWAELIARHKPVVAGLPPTAMRMVLDARVPKEALASLRAVRVGTAPLDPALGDEFERVYGIPPLVVYGATEFAGAVAGWTLKEYRRFGLAKRGSVGRAHPGVRLRIVDQEDGRELGPGEVGLLEVNAPQLQRDGAVQEWVRTTDLASIDEDGFVWIKGRADDVVIRGGFKVSTTQVADVLKSHPAVRDGSVIGIPDARLGQVPVAAVELRDDLDDKPTPEDLVTWLRARLAPYQVPVEVRIVDALPRTPSMKVSQPAIRELFAPA